MGLEGGWMYEWAGVKPGLGNCLVQSRENLELGDNDMAHFNFFFENG